METTPRLLLQYPDGPDFETDYPAVSKASMEILDAAVLFAQDTISNRPTNPSPSSGLLFHATDTDTWSISAGGVWYPFAAGVGAQTVIASDPSYAIPVAAKTLLLICVGGGGGGGGTNNDDVYWWGGGGGGGAGGVTQRIVPVGDNAHLAITIGAGGAGGVQSDGQDGGTTSILGDGTGINVSANGGQGGQYGLMGTGVTPSAPVVGGVAGGAGQAPFRQDDAAAAFSPVSPGPGCGGWYASTGQTQGGAANGYAGGGGGAGARGSGGSAGTANAGGAAGVVGAPGPMTGGSAGANTAAGGGGGGQDGAAGFGNGGAGGSGYAIVMVLN